MANLKESTLQTKTFEAKFRGQRVFVDVVKFSDEHHEAWIYTDRMGVKELMFGNGYCDSKKFLELVQDNFEEYATSYLERNH